MCSMTGMNNELNIIRLIILLLGLGQSVSGLSRPMTTIQRELKRSRFTRQYCSILDRIFVLSANLRNLESVD
jgi:hypothetical protein